MLVFRVKMLVLYLAFHGCQQSQFVCAFKLFSVLSRTPALPNALGVPIIVPLQDPVTWHGINYTGTQMTQWDFQNKGKSGWTCKSSFVLEVPLRYLRPSVIYSVPCDRILQRDYYCKYPMLLDFQFKESLGIPKKLPMV